MRSLPRGAALGKPAGSAHPIFAARDPAPGEEALLWKGDAAVGLLQEAVGCFGLGRPAHAKEWAEKGGQAGLASHSRRHVVLHCHRWGKGNSPPHPAIIFPSIPDRSSWTDKAKTARVENENRFYAAHGMRSAGTNTGKANLVGLGLALFNRR